MNTYTIFRAMEICQSRILGDDVMRYPFLVTVRKERQYYKFRDEMVRRCERYELAKETIKDLKEQRDQLVRERIIE